MWRLPLPQLLLCCLLPLLLLLPGPGQRGRPQKLQPPAHCRRHPQLPVRCLVVTVAAVLPFAAVVAVARHAPRGCVPPGLVPRAQPRPLDATAAAAGWPRPARRICLQGLRRRAARM